jgi:hypothetical protein
MSFADFYPNGETKMTKRVKVRVIHLDKTEEIKYYPIGSMDNDLTTSYGDLIQDGAIYTAFIEMEDFGRRVDLDTPARSGAGPRRYGFVIKYFSQTRRVAFELSVVHDRFEISRKEN